MIDAHRRLAMMNGTPVPDAIVDGIPPTPPGDGPTGLAARDGDTPGQIPPAVPGQPGLEP
jgi:hypothetical protein